MRSLCSPTVLFAALIASLLAATTVSAQGSFSPITKQDMVALQFMHYYSADDKAHDADFDWTFDASNFKIAARQGPISADLLKQLAPDNLDAKVIEGRWKLDRKPGGQLLLFKLEVDGKPLEGERRLGMFKSAPTVIRIGTPQHVFGIGP